MDEININDFAKVDLRVARVKDAQMVEEADKLIKLELDLGDLGLKTVFAGIKKAYSPDDLKDKLWIWLHLIYCMVGDYWNIDNTYGVANCYYNRTKSNYNN